MMFVIVLAPFLTFAVLMLAVPPVVSLFSASAVALLTIGYDVARGRSVKMLAAGAAVLFAAVGVYLVLIDRGLTNQSIRLAVDVGVLGIALVSLGLRLPFTLQYAREVVAPEVARTPIFLTTNYILTLAWTFAFVLMLIADILMIVLPSLPVWVGLAIAFAARNCAIYFTKWFSARRRAQFAALSG